MDRNCWSPNEVSWEVLPLEPPTPRGGRGDPVRLRALVGMGSCYMYILVTQL